MPYGRFGGRARRSRPEELECALKALVHPLRRKMRQQRLSQGQIALYLGCDRSRVSRALSGRELPPLSRIEEIAELVGADVEQARQQWRRAAALHRKAQTSAAEGGPPQGMANYPDFLQALNELRFQNDLSQRELVRRDTTGKLTRSTVGAVLRGERSATLAMVVAYVRACGVSELAVNAWESAWERLAYPHMLHQHYLRWLGMKRRECAERMRLEEARYGRPAGRWWARELRRCPSDREGPGSVGTGPRR